MIPFADYAPDRSTYDMTVSRAISNAQPVEGGWGPFPSNAPVSNALAADCKGAITTLNKDGDYAIFAGTSTKLYRYNTGTQDWDDVSTGAGTYTLPDGDFWSFYQWGNFLLATNISNGLYSFDLDGGSAFVSVTAAPKAKFVSAAGEHVMLGHLDGEPNDVRWSEIGDLTEWTLLEGGADEQEFSDGGVVRGIVPGELGVIVGQQRAIRSVGYVGGEFTFTTSRITSSRGIVSPASLVVAGNSYFFMDEDGFYQGSGGQILPIGAEKVNRTILEEIDLDSIELVQGAADPVNKMVWWLITKVDTTRFMVGYDWQLGRWARVDVDCKYLFDANIPGYTIDDLDAIYASLDDIDVSLDSRLFAGGRPTFAAIDADDKMGFFSGLPYEATLETADVALVGTKNRAYVSGYSVLTDAVTHTGQVATKDNHAGARTWSSVASPESGTGVIPADNDGRLHRFRAIIEAGQSWNIAHGVEPDFVPAGEA